MKKIALLPLAALLLSPSAFAADAGADENFAVDLGGYFKGYVNYTDQDTVPGTEVRDTDILRRTEVHFNGEKKLESGTKIGVHVEGLADPGADFAIDESLLYVSGDWGNVNFGGKDGAAFLLQVAAPAADKDLDGLRQQIQPVNLTAFGTTVGETDYDQNISAKSDKITYITPIFEGFQAGVSYTPEVDNSRGANGNSLSNDDTTANSDVCDVAIRYQQKFEDVKVTAGAGYTHAKRETGAGDNNRQAWNVGLSVGFKGFNIGAAYQNDDEGSLGSNDVAYSVIGIDYKIEKFTIGASYYNKDDNVGTQIDTDRYTAGVSYAYAPGIAFRTSVSKLKSDVNGGSDFDATSVVFGTLIDF